MIVYEILVNFSNFFYEDKFCFGLYSSNEAALNAIKNIKPIEIAKAIFDFYTPDSDPIVIDEFPQARIDLENRAVDSWALKNYYIKFGDCEHSRCMRGFKIAQRPEYRYLEIDNRGVFNVCLYIVNREIHN